MKVHQHIGAVLEEYATQAKSVCIAVALAKDKALDILNLMPKSCKVRLIVGVDLPTPIPLLKNFRTLYGDNARIYNNVVFHPKVYLFELKNCRTVAVLGSSNFTSGGLYSNIELSIEFDDQPQIDEIKNWFHQLFISSQPITDEFLDKYRTYAEQQEKLNKLRKKAIKELKPALDGYAEARERIISFLKSRKKQKAYKEAIANRPAVVEVLRSALDIENDFKGFNPNPFLSIPELGNIRPAYKDPINAAVKNGEIAEMLKLLTDNTIPIHIRFNQAIKGDARIYGMGHNFISKMLCAYDPTQYVVWNKPTNAFFNNYVPIKDSAMDEGERYEFYCKFFKSICDEVGLNDFSELDALIWDYK